MVPTIPTQGVKWYSDFMLRKALVVISWRKNPLDEAQILMLRVREDRGGFWQPVTGSIEEGETFEEGGLREAMEETGFTFTRALQYLGMEYQYRTRWGKDAVERAYLLPVEGESPPTPRLDPKEHVDFQWVPASQAPALSPFPTNQEAIKRANTHPVFLHRSGRFYQEGEEITHERTVALLHRSITQLKDGWKIKVGEEQVDLVVDDTPRFVTGFEGETGKLSLLGCDPENLDPETLVQRPDNSFSCVLKNGWRAKFLSPAHYQLAQNIQSNDQGKNILTIKKSQWEIRSTTGQ